ncbi:MAG: response regulator transcription factor [Haliscomenobacter sp.]|jgi:two-component system response regulator VicR|nr:response regulator transcription factor [Haliscomenobacter sp.]MBK8654580.1 response regulator transcription factor [Haliscomenobacter sp.]MBP9076044.1 response regulator transcription factor [Haliscomenobacter sp.]MBP9873415.1 response regulator transcription factor [Haliscomenobacter sp.]MBV6427176.1 Alkaline phosphatase synthesis transcriptional regulatory protein SphR [Haliscomenobacter sp.]
MKILICESEEVLLAAIEFRLRKQGFDVAFCKKKASVEEHVIKEDPDLVLIDLDMGKQSGLEIVRLVKQLQGDKAKTLLLADPDEEEQIVEGFSIGINDFLSKPFKPAELILRVRRILGK